MKLWSGVDEKFYCVFGEHNKNRNKYIKYEKYAVDENINRNERKKYSYMKRVAMALIFYGYVNHQVFFIAQII